MAPLAPRSVRRVSSWLLVAGVSLGLATPAGADDLAVRPDRQAIYGGTRALTCQWPTTVSVDTGPSYCTGTLVHPEIMVYAAHCVHGPSAGGVYFGEWDESDDPNHWVSVDFCKAHPEFGSPVGNNDIAFCKLSTPVLGPPPTPPLMGCEADTLVQGREIAIAGFGFADDGSSAHKHWAMTTLGPSVPGLPHAVQIGGGGVGACVGDSGGPAYAQLDDGTWRAFGVVSGGSSCGQDGVYMLMHPYVAWIEAESGIDITPCHDADGTWNPSPNCGGFAMDPLATGLSWDNGCAGEISGPSSTCGVPFSGADDEPPVVAIAQPHEGERFPEAPASTTVLVTADDGDGEGVREVWLKIDGEEAARGDAPPYTFDGVPLPAGRVELIAFAEDHAGNVGASSPVVVVVGDELDPSERGDTGGSSEDDDETGESPSAGSEPNEESGCTCQASRSGPSALVTLALGLLLVRERRGVFEGSEARRRS
jgi:hypothetical protein